MATVGNGGGCRQGSRGGRSWWAGPGFSLPQRRCARSLVLQGPSAVSWPPRRGLSSRTPVVRVAPPRPRTAGVQVPPIGRCGESSGGGAVRRPFWFRRVSRKRAGACSFSGRSIVCCSSCGVSILVDDSASGWVSITCCHRPRLRSPPGRRRGSLRSGRPRTHSNPKSDHPTRRYPEGAMPSRRPRGEEQRKRKRS